MAGLEAHYSARDIEARILAALRAAGLDPEQRLAPDELAALDHFHTGGLRASRELMELAQIRAEDRVLDIGAGLAGSARLLASALGCRVDCIEMSTDYCVGAALLNRLTGLDDRIAVHEGSALELPFADESFDVVWMQNVGMNIEDKRKLYAEIRRVLKPGGRYAFQEMAAGKTATSWFPLPWATDPTENFLVSVEAMQSLLDESGLTTELLEDTSDAHLSGATTNATPAAPESWAWRCTSTTWHKRPRTRDAVWSRARFGSSEASETAMSRRFPAQVLLRGEATDEQPGALRQAGSAASRG
jgi:sarcosine/dimethylglycine N-methyltransferase